jgi:hypothetical protein
MAEREAKNAAKGARAQIYLKTSHDVIRAQSSPVPVKSKIEKTALAPIGARKCGGSAYLTARPDGAATGSGKSLFSVQLLSRRQTLAAC